MIAFQRILKQISPVCHHLPITPSQIAISSLNYPTTACAWLAKNKCTLRITLQHALNIDRDGPVKILVVLVCLAISSPNPKWMTWVSSI